MGGYIYIIQRYDRGINDIIVRQRSEKSDEKSDKKSRAIEYDVIMCVNCKLYRISGSELYKWQLTELSVSDRQNQESIEQNKKIIDNFLFDHSYKMSFKDIEVVDQNDAGQINKLNNVVSSDEMSSGDDNPQYFYYQFETMVSLSQLNDLLNPTGNKLVEERIKLFARCGSEKRVFVHVYAFYNKNTGKMDSRVYFSLSGLGVEMVPVKTNDKGVKRKGVKRNDTTVEEIQSDIEMHTLFLRDCCISRDKNSYSGNIKGSVIEGDNSTKFDGISENFYWQVFDCFNSMNKGLRKSWYGIEGDY